MQMPKPPRSGGIKKGGSVMGKLPIPPPLRRKKFRFQVEKGITGGQKTSLTYREEQKDKLIEDVWFWLHEENEIEISIKKERV
jgi:hypothetical protein